MRVVVAPDKFKGSATASQVAAAIGAGLRRVRPDLEVAELPVADGGDGTVSAALAAGFSPVPVIATGPTGEPVRATFALSGGTGGTAVIELADVSGLRRLPDGLAPLTASTFGVGQVISAALGRDPGTIVLGLGGSASSDGGAGMVQALGVSLADDRGTELPRGGAALARLATVDVSGLDERVGAVQFLVASDVSNPLLGPSGAAAVFGPQKGATPSDVALLDQALARWAELTARVPRRAATAGQPAGGTGSLTGEDAARAARAARAAGAGAAGGVGFAALAYLGARIVPGIDLVLDLIDFDAALAGTGLVITGEGSMDRQTLGGKAPLGVARAAARHGVPVTMVAGQILLTEAELAAAGFSAAYSLADIEPDRERSMASAEHILHEIGAQIAASLPATTS